MAQVSEVLYEKTIEVRWSDCDANQHMRHSAYADFCAHTRLGLMHHVGISEKWLKENGLGPVLFKEETEYFRELFMGEMVRVTLEMGEPTGSEKSVCLINHLYNAKGELAARHSAVLGWFGMTERKVVKLPETIRQLCLPEPETLE